MWPEASLEVSFTADPDVTAPAWTALTNRIRELDLRVYRQSELDDFEGGDLFAKLDNRDRSLEPFYAASPYYPNVVPRRRCRYRIRWASVSYYRFLGFWRVIPLAWEPTPDATVELQASDYGLILNRAQVTLNGFPEELVHTRIGRVLDAINIPAADRAIDASTHTVAAVPAIAQGGSEAIVGALEHCRDAAKSDGGYLYIARDGKVTFHNRRHRRDVSSAVQIAFRNDGAGTPYRPGLVASLDDSRIWNRVAAITYDGVREELRDQASADRYWDDRKEDFQSLLSKPGEAAALASLDLFRYKDPRLRLPRIEVVVKERGAMTSARIVALLQADVGTRCSITHQPPGGGSPLTAEVHIEGIQDHIDPATGYTMSFDVSPADPTLSEWVLGTSALDVTTRVGI